MNAIFHLRVAGVLLLVLRALNVFLPIWFDWRTELPRLSLINRRIMQAHAFFLALLIGMMGGLSLFLAADLARPTRLARALLVSFASFWCLRLLAQWFFYDWSLWRGHGWKTLAHAVATMLWSYLAFAYGGALWADPN